MKYSVAYKLQEAIIPINLLGKNSFYFEVVSMLLIRICEVPENGLF